MDLERGGRDLADRREGPLPPEGPHDQIGVDADRTARIDVSISIGAHHAEVHALRDELELEHFRRAPARSQHRGSRRAPPSARARALRARPRRGGQADCARRRCSYAVAEDHRRVEQIPRPPPVRRANGTSGMVGLGAAEAPFVHAPERAAQAHLRELVPEAVRAREGMLEDQPARDVEVGEADVLVGRAVAGHARRDRSHRVAGDRASSNARCRRSAIQRCASPAASIESGSIGVGSKGAHSRGAGSLAQAIDAQNRIAIARLMGSASSAARERGTKTRRAARSSSSNASNASRAGSASPPCARIASSIVGARPS